MSSTNKDLALALRKSAWERAKGELRSIGHFFWAEFDSPEEGQNFIEMTKRIEAFIKDFEDHHA